MCLWHKTHGKDGLYRVSGQNTRQRAQTNQEAASSIPRIKPLHRWILSDPMAQSAPLSSPFLSLLYPLPLSPYPLPLSLFSIHTPMYGRRKKGMRPQRCRIHAGAADRRPRPAKATPAARPLAGGPAPLARPFPPPLLTTRRRATEPRWSQHSDGDPAISEHPLAV